MKRAPPSNDSTAATIVSVVLFVAILWALGAFGDAAELWARIRT